MIEKKKSLSRIPKNLVHEKTRLKQLHLAAMSSGNEGEAEKIQDQLAQLEELAQGNRDGLAVQQLSLSIPGDGLSEECPTGASAACASMSTLVR